MPIEIRELHIKAVVENATENGSGSTTPTNGSSEPDEALIRICVDRVMELIQNAKER